MSGKHSIGEDSYDSVEIYKCRVVTVNTTKWTAEVVSENNRFHSEVQIAPTYVNADGGGAFSMPETNSVVWVCKPSDQRTPFIMMGCSLPREPDEDEGDPANMRMNRPVINEGDTVVASSDGATIILRKGGVIEIGANQTAQRFYIPLQSVIRDLCQNYELITAGGSMSLKSRRDDDTHGEAVTPVEFNLKIKDFAQDEPIIELGLGRIKNEDNQSVVGGNIGQVVARLLINDSFKIWIDKDGNVMSTTYGTTTNAYNAKKTDFYDKAFFQRVKGLFSGRYLDQDVHVSRSYSKWVGRESAVEIGGNETVRVHGSSAREYGAVTEEVKGNENRVVGGELDEQIIGNLKQSIAGGRSIGVGGNSDEGVAGTKSTTIVGAHFGDPINDTSYQLLVGSGAIQIHSITGKVKISSSLTPATALARIIVKPTGAIVLESILGLAQIEVNATGCSIFTAAGEITVDNIGSVYLGPIGGGPVVTTLSHPTDYITGAPILGSSSVQAGGIPSIIGIPSTFMPDIT